MQWASAESRQEPAQTAATQVASELREELGGAPADLMLAFVSGPGRARCEAAIQTLRAEFPATTFALVSTRGVVTRAHEVEQGAALSVIAARLPGVEVKPFLLMRESWAEAVESEEAFDLRAPGARGAELVVLLGDPFSLDVDRILSLFNRWAPGVRVVGGLASASSRPLGNTVALNDWSAHEGGLGLAFHGALRVDVIVSQGCAPFGPPLDVTHVEDNLILTLDGQPAVERIEQVLRDMPEAERSRLAQGLYVGRPARGDASGRGDYLIRNLLGADRERGAIAVADMIGAREKIRLHVRDARAALDDLQMLLSPQAFDSAASGMLLFACNGRGQGLFGEADRDIRTLQESLVAQAPCAGMFCAGELGPVGGRNFLHGHTASIAIIRPR